MFDEGLKAREAEERCQALDVAEIVALSLGEEKPA
jgi:hypothetical protein